MDQMSDQMNENSDVSSQILEEMCLRLRKTIAQIFTTQSKLAPSEYMALYTLVYKYRNSAELRGFKLNLRETITQVVFKKLCKQVSEFLEGYLVELFKCSDSLSDEEVEEQVLIFYARKWEEFRFSSKVLNRIWYIVYGFINNDSVERRSEVFEVYQLALVSWRYHFLKNLHKQESSDFLAKYPLTEYMKHVEQRLHEEYKEHQSTEVRLLETCTYVWIDKNLDRFRDEFQILLNLNKFNDLAQMYNLISRIKGGLKAFTNIFQKEVYDQGWKALEKCGNDVLNDRHSGAKLFVKTILTVYKKYNGIVTNLFENNDDFVDALDKACANFINKNFVSISSENDEKSAFLLAQYNDTVLKKSSKNVEEAELEETLNDILIVFKYIRDKDVYQNYYIQFLVKRLVYRLSASDDAEESMMSKLKHACGFEFTFKMQKIFNDIGLSKDVTVRFRHHMRTILPEHDFSILIFASGSWAFKNSCENFLLPFQLEKSYSEFNYFYTTSKTNHKLKWLHDMSNGELVSNCFTKKYTFLVSTFQMAVLLQFNEQTSTTVQEIETNTGISKEYLTQIINVFLKAKLVTSDDDANKINDNSVLRLFQDYENKRLRVNINIPLKAQQKKEDENVKKAVEGDRKCLIQAAIVRIMKTRKVLQHSLLVAEVMETLGSRFQPKVQMIKQAITQLMDQEYMERVENENDTYSYMA